MDMPSKKKIEDVDFDTVVADIATLKRDVSKVLEQIKAVTVNGAVDSMSDAVDSIEDLAGNVSNEATKLYKAASKRGRKLAGTIERQVDDQPVMSLLVAFTIGLFASRLFSR